MLRTPLSSYFDPNSHRTNSEGLRPVSHFAVIAFSGLDQAALSEAIAGRKVNWILDADIRAFFDEIDHEWMLRFLEHRIADKRVIRLIRKWLMAGTNEDGHRVASVRGTPQDSVISPAFKYLPALCTGPVGSPMAPTTCCWRCHPCALCRWQRNGVSIRRGSKALSCGNARALPSSNWNSTRTKRG